MREKRLGELRRKIQFGAESDRGEVVQSGEMFAQLRAKLQQRQADEPILFQQKNSDSNSITD